MPRGRQQYYYVASLVIESLSLSELDEAERWLRGDLATALSTKGDVGNSSAAASGACWSASPGLPRLGLESRSSYFRP